MCGHILRHAQLSKAPYKKVHRLEVTQQYVKVAAAVQQTEPRAEATMQQGPCGENARELKRARSDKTIASLETTGANQTYATAFFWHFHMRLPVHEAAAVTDASEATFRTAASRETHRREEPGHSLHAEENDHIAERLQILEGLAPPKLELLKFPAANLSLKYLNRLLGLTNKTLKSIDIEMNALTHCLIVRRL